MCPRLDLVGCVVSELVTGEGETVIGLIELLGLLLLTVIVLSVVAAFAYQTRKQSQASAIGDGLPGGAKATATIAARTRTIYAVQAIDSESGAESIVRVEAKSPDEARTRVIAIGMIVGSVTLAEIAETPTSQSSAPPGSVASACPKCGRSQWTGGRGCGLWGLIVILFPIGLLLLFIQPRWLCQNCGYTYNSYTPPAGITRADQTVAYQIVRGVLVAVLVILLLILVAAFLR